MGPSKGQEVIAAYRALIAGDPGTLWLFIRLVHLVIHLLGIPHVEF